jgi:hypothetical protein
MQELIKYKGIGPKSASVVMTWCLKRKSFTVDTHVYRVAGLWGWRPKDATREKTQAHLDAVIPNELKFDLHFLFIAHGRTCPACKGGAKAGQKCTAREEVEAVTTSSRCRCRVQAVPPFCSAAIVTEIDLNLDHHSIRLQAKCLACQPVHQLPPCMLLIPPRRRCQPTVKCRDRDRSTVFASKRAKSPFFGVSDELRR